MDDALPVDDRNLANASVPQHLCDGHTRSARAGDDDLAVLEVTIGETRRVDQCGQNNDSGPVLVVVENRDVESLDQAALDLEAPWTRDVFQVDATKGGREADDGFDDLVYIRRVEGHRDGVHPTELLEQHGLALHHGHRRMGPDVTEAEHGGAVGDDGDGVGHPGVLVGSFGVSDDRFTDPRDARGVRQRQVVRVAQRDSGDYLHLAAAVQRKDRIVVRVRRGWSRVEFSRHHFNPGQRIGRSSPASGRIREPIRSRWIGR